MSLWSRFKKKVKSFFHMSKPKYKYTPSKSKPKKNNSPTYHSQGHSNFIANNRNYKAEVQREKARKAAEAKKKEARLKAIRDAVAKKKKQDAILKAKQAKIKLIAQQKKQQSLKDLNKATDKYKKSQEDKKKLQGGLSDAEVTQVQNISRLPAQAQKIMYSNLDKGNAEKYGIKKGFSNRVAKAEETGAKSNPALYGFIQGSSPIANKKVSEETTGRKINTAKVEKSAPYKAGYLGGQLLQYVSTGGVAEGAIAAKLGAKGATKAVTKALGSKTAAKALVKNSAKKGLKSITVNGKKIKLAGFGARRVADAVASTPLNLSQAIGQSDNKKDVVKNYAVNTATDMAFGTALEGAGKGAKSLYKVIKKTKKGKVPKIGDTSNSLNTSKSVSKKAEMKVSAYKKAKELSKPKTAEVKTEIPNVVSKVSDVNSKGSAEVSSAKGTPKVSAKGTPKVSAEVSSAKGSAEVKKADSEIKSIDKEISSVKNQYDEGKIGREDYADMITDLEIKKNAEIEKRAKILEKQGSDVAIAKSLDDKGTTTPKSVKTSKTAEKQPLQANAKNTAKSDVETAKSDVETPKSEEKTGGETTNQTKYKNIEKYPAEDDIPDWVLDKGLNEGERFAFRTSEKKVVRETEKARLVEADTDYGKVSVWVPKSVQKQPKKLTAPERKRLAKAVVSGDRKTVARITEELNKPKETKMGKYVTKIEPKQTSEVSKVEMAETPKMDKNEMPTKTSQTEKVETAKIKSEIKPLPKTEEGRVAQVSAKTEKIKMPTNVKLHNSIKTAQRQIVNALQPIEDIAKRERKLGNIEKAEKIEASANAFRQADQKAARNITEKQLDYNGNELGEGLVGIFKEISDDESVAIQKYLYHKHNIARFEHGKPVFGEGVTDNLSRLFIKRFEKESPQLVEKSKGIRKYLDNLQIVRKQSGLISDSQKAFYDELYPDYVPTYRDDIKLNNVNQFQQQIGISADKNAKGSSRNLKPLQEQMADQTMKVWRDAELNKLLNDVVSSEQHEVAKIMKWTPEEELSSITLLEKEEGRYYLKFYEDGEIRRVETSEDIYKGLEEEMKGGTTGFDVLDDFNKAMSKVANVFKQLITSLSPIFLVRNGLRDFPEAMLNSKQTFEFIKSVPQAVNEIVTGGKYYKSMLNSGVKKSSFFDINATITGDGKFKNFLKKIEAANDVIEMFPRMTEYIATFKKAGKVLEEADKDFLNKASVNAADVTVNFGRGGQTGRVLNKGLVPFFNPAVQGASKFARVLTGQKGVKGYLNLALKATAMGIVPAVLNEMLLSDDENYQMLNARDKLNHYCIPIGDDGLFVKIPKARFLAVFGMLPQSIVSEDKEEFASLIKIGIDNVGPINPVTSNLFSPIVGTAMNKTWYGSDIESKADSDTKVNEIYGPNTTETSKVLSTALSKVGIEISPKKLDYLVDSYTGIAGDILMPLATKSMKGENPLSKVVKKSFALDSVYQNNVSSKYYEMQDELKKNSKSVNATKADKLKEKAFKSYESRIGAINDAIRYLKDGNSKTKEEDVKELTKLRNSLMEKATNGTTSKNNTKDIDVFYKAVGAEKTIEFTGNSVDNSSMKIYKAAVGKVDEDYFKGYKAIKNVQQKLKSKGLNDADGITKAVALAEVGASNNVAKAYGLANKSSLETKNKIARAKDYIKNGGTLDEYLKISEVLKNMGVSSYDKKQLLKSKLKQVKNGSMTMKEYTSYKKNLDNSPTSYVAKAIALATIGAKDRDYALIDIKEKNVQNGINLAAIGITPRGFKKLKQSADADGNNYVKKVEAISFLSSGKYSTKEKAAIFSAIAPTSNNPFGSVSYSRKEASKGKTVSSAKTKTVKVTKIKKVQVPKTAILVTGKKIDLTKMSKSDIAGLMRNSAYVREIKYGTVNRKVTEDKKVKVNAKDNTTLTPSGTSSGGYSRSGYSRRGRSGSGRSGGSSGGSDIKITATAQKLSHTNWGTKAVRTNAQIKALLKQMMKNNYS